MTELQQQLRDLIRTASRMLDQPASIADAKILVGQAQCAEALTRIEFLATIRERAPREDSEAQEAMVRAWGEPK